jgi:multiple sugar transport system substrate-binding protein
MSYQHPTNSISSDNASSHAQDSTSTSTLSSTVSRRNFLKQSVQVAGAASLSGVLAACAASGFGGGSSSSGSSGGGGSITINFWDMNWGNSSYFDIGKQLVNDFNNSHKGINVVYRGVPWANWYQTFTTAIGSGTQPDISTGASFMGAQFYSTHNVLALDDVVDEAKKNSQYDDFLPNSFAPMQYQGHTITWPWAIDIRIPLYRTDLFQQAGAKVPTTWDELRAVSKKLTANGKYGMVNSGADNVTEHMLEMLMINNGGGLFTADGKLDFATNPRNIEALRFFSDLVQDGSFDPASTGYQSADAIRAFGRGDGAILVNGPGAIAQLDAATAKKVSVLPPIASPHGTKGTLFWVNNIIVYSGTKHPNETKAFLLWWSQNNKPLWAKGGCSPLPIRTSFYQDELFKTPRIEAIRSQYVPIAKSANAQATSVFPALNPLDGDGTLVTLGQNLLGKKDFNTSVQTAQAGLKKVMDSNPG